MYLDDCKTLFATSFEVGWEKFEEEASDSITEPFFNLYSYLNSFSIDFFKKLNLSVIKGEYVNEPRFLSVLHELIDSFEELLATSPQEDDNASNKFNDILLNEFLLPIISSLRSYSRIHDVVAQKIQQPNKLLIEPIDTFIHGDKSEWLQVYENASFFVDVNLSLVKYDHILSLKTNVLIEIMLLLNRLLKEYSYAIDSHVKELLKYKCNYLVSKILARQSSNSGKFTFLSHTGFIDIEFNEDACGAFGNFIKVMTLHYFDDTELADDESFEVKARTSLSKKANDEILSYEDYHAIVKYYKDKEINEEELNSLVYTFKGQQVALLQSINLFDKRAAQVTINYLENNLLSYYIDNTSISIDDLVKKISKIERIQIESNVKNYFPYLKACVYIKDYLEVLFKEKRVNIDAVDKAIDTLSMYEKKLIQYYEWCEESNFIAFQAPYKECIHSYQIEDAMYEVFSYTSFVLPINFEKDRKIIEDISLSILRFMTLSEIHKSIYPEVAIIEDISERVQTGSRKVEKIGKQVESTEKKNIEILSIFAAIVLFVASDIQMFPKVDSLDEALTFMLVFAYSLGLFAILIWLVTRDYSIEEYKIPKVHKAVIGIWIISTLTAFAFIFYKSKDTIVKPKGILQLRSERDSITSIIDSLTTAYQKSQHEVDSVANGKIEDSKDKFPNSPK